MTALHLSRHPYLIYIDVVMIEPLLIAQLGVLGLFTGFLAGLLGIGGGMLMVPFITAIMVAQGLEPGLSVKVAIATSMSTIIFTSISSVWAHHKRGAVRWDIVWRLSPGIVLGAALASMGVFAVLNGQWLAFVFAAFVAFSATQMLFDIKPKAGRTMPGTGGQLVAGSTIGFLAGLVGAGGGFASVPFMTWCNVLIHNAVATSAALGFPIALANAVGYVVAGQSVAGLPEAAWGYVYWPALIVISVASVAMAPLGVKAAHALPVKSLKRVFALLLYLLAAFMLYQGATG